MMMNSRSTFLIRLSAQLRDEGARLGVVKGLSEVNRQTTTTTNGRAGQGPTLQQEGGFSQQRSRKLLPACSVTLLVSTIPPKHKLVLCLARNPFAGCCCLLALLDDRLSRQTTFLASSVSLLLLFDDDDDDGTPTFIHFSFLLDSLWVLIPTL